MINTVIDGSFPDILEFIKEHHLEWLNTPEIWDLSKVPWATTSNEELQSFLGYVRSDAEHHRGKKCALVATSDFGYGMVRMFEVFADNENFPHVMYAFRTVEEALEWVNQ